MKAREKILDLAAARRFVDEARARNERVVFTNGCFDLLHAGHLQTLEAARALGDRLVVAINSDASVARLKGAERPIQPASTRLALVAALACVDVATEFDEDTPLGLIEALVPDVLAKGGDWAREQIVGADLVEARGGQIARLDVLEGESTSAIVERLAALGASACARSEPVPDRFMLHVSLVVRDYDEALAFFVGRLGFVLCEDTVVPEQDKRWVTIRPAAGSGTTIVLARASTPAQEAVVGRQTGGRVGFFLGTRDFEADYERFRAEGIRFIRPPKTEPYGRVAVFEDLYGNAWDLLEPSTLD